MSSLDLVYQYMDIVFSSSDLNQLREILAENLIFEGPFYKFQSAEDYINSLLADPPKDFHYQLLQSFEKDYAVCLIYKFSKPGTSTTMAQTFEIVGNSISRIELVFDTAAFS